VVGGTNQVALPSVSVSTVTHPHLKQKSITKGQHTEHTATHISSCVKPHLFSKQQSLMKVSYVTV